MDNSEQNAQREERVMAKITVEYGELVVEIEGIDALWALRSQLEIPLTHVRGAAFADACVADMAVRSEAAPVSGAVSGGSFVRCGDCVFWEVREPAKAVVIELVDDRYARLVVETDDPATAVARINRAVADRQARGNGTAQ
jgi:hypothetical protein